MGEDNKDDAAFDAQFAAAQAAVDWTFADGPADQALKAEALYRAAREYARLADIAWGEPEGEGQ
jgi:hypothetical protein